MVRTIAKDYDDKRRHILDVAAEVFARQGIVRASMSDVAQACGISKANIYHYYPSKHGIVFDILDSYLSELRNLVFAIDRGSLTPQEQLHAITREILLAYKGMDHQHRIQVEGLPLLEEAKQQILKDYQRQLVALVSEVLIACAPTSLGDNKTESRNVTMSVFGMLNWFYMWNSDASNEDRECYARSVAELTLSGINER